MLEKLSEFLKSSVEKNGGKVIKFYSQAGDDRVTNNALTAEGACGGLVVSWICKAVKYGAKDPTHFWNKMKPENGLPKRVKAVMEQQEKEELPMFAPINALKEKKYLRALPGSFERFDIDVLAKTLEVTNTATYIALIGSKGNHAMGCTHLREHAFQFYDPNFGEAEFYSLQNLTSWLQALFERYRQGGHEFSDMAVKSFAPQLGSKE